jgi:tRNA(adenine34) deaminase
VKSPFGFEQDVFFMKRALRQAQLAYVHNEVPVGALVVDAQGTILGQGYNKTEKRSSQAFHAEMCAIAKAGKKLGDWRLNGCWVYVTLEPCAMCMHLIQLSRCAGVVFGAKSPLFGYQVVDKDSRFSVYKEDVVNVVAGVCEQESAALLKCFFKDRRKRRNVYEEKQAKVVDIGKVKQELIIDARIARRVDAFIQRKFSDESKI